jgi:hypothetical protein
MRTIQPKGAKSAKKRKEDGEGVSLVKFIILIDTILPTKGSNLDSHSK